MWKAGEDILTAAKREIYEETGISTLELIKPLGSYTRYKIGKDGIGEDRQEEKTIHMFLFKTNEQKLQPLDPDNPEARWISKEEVCRILTHEKDREFFQSILFELN